MFFEVIPTDTFLDQNSTLVYTSNYRYQPGHIVLVPLGRRTVVGVVLRKLPTNEATKITFTVKSILKLLLPVPIPPHLLAAIPWLAHYYLAPISHTANLAIPAGLTSRGALDCLSDPHFASLKPSRAETTVRERYGLKTAHKASPKLTEDISGGLLKLPLIPLNQPQKTALQGLEKAPSYTRMLRGVTGSGKTNLYLQLTAEALKKQKSTILLVPEIALTSQLVKIFTETFGARVLLVHSNQTLAERRKIWLKILLSGQNLSLFKPYLTPEKSSKASKSPKVIPASKTATEPPLTAKIEQSSLFDNGQKSAKKPNKKPKNPSKAQKCLDFSDLLLTKNGKYATMESCTAEPLVIIGPRSALLTPVQNLGQIIIDEAHEGAYYQENAPRYSALRLASFIAGKLKIPCLLGSATPNLVDYHLAKTKNSLVELTQKAKNTAVKPRFTIVDLKNRDLFYKNRYLSNPLISAIDKNLANHHQTLIFHNRRGSAPLTICEDCGWQALCPICYLPMTLHADGYILTCHICGHEEKVPSSCPNCHHAGIIHKGFGTKLLETELQHLFPEAKIARFDGDNKKGGDLASLYHEVKAGAIDILIGTQTLARGLDLPHLATVGVVQADAGLALPDFAAEERTFQLLAQVFGRVGRGHLDQANVIIQTYQPDHPVIQTAIEADFPRFADYLIKKRRAQSLPPFYYLARLAITYKTEKTTLSKIRAAHKTLSQIKNLTVSPPTPAFHERTSRGYTWQIILKSTSRETLRHALTPFSAHHIELDPPSLL